MKALVVSLTALSLALLAAALVAGIAAAWAVDADMCERFANTAGVLALGGFVSAVFSIGTWASNG